MSNSLDPNQAQHFVGPDLGPNYFQRLSADNTLIVKELKKNKASEKIFQEYIRNSFRNEKLSG